ncbi:hypothetical protein TNCV_3544881 [Trichonephila clavipes]|nr:hypothetical protein TNCV_3544881 [Trichonephila clavipes]
MSKTGERVSPLLRKRKFLPRNVMERMITSRLDWYLEINTLPTSSLRLALENVSPQTNKLFFFLASPSDALIRDTLLLPYFVDFEGL